MRGNFICNLNTKHRLSSDPAISMDFEPFLAKVWFVLGIYFSFAWSRFKIRLSGILWSSTTDTLSCKYKSWASFFAPSGTSILSVVFMRFLKPILRKRLFAQDDESRSMWSYSKCGFSKLPLLRRANRNFWTIWSKLSNKRRCFLGKTFRFDAMGRFSFLAFSSSALYTAQNPLTKPS